MSTDRPGDGGFFASLFDFSFQSFITTKLIKVLYILAIIAVGFWAVALLVGGLSQGGTTAFFALIGAIIGFFIGIIYVRVLLELVIVVFRIGEHTATMARAFQSGTPPWQAPAEPYPAPQPYTAPPAPASPPPAPPQPGWEPPPAPTAEAEEPTRPLSDPDDERGPGDVPPPPPSQT